MVWRQFLSGLPNVDMLSAITISVCRLLSPCTVSWILNKVVYWSMPDPDQSCCQCGTQGIQVAPLQRQVRWRELPELSHTIIRWTHQCQNGFNLFLGASIQLHTLPRCMITFSLFACHDLKAFGSALSAVSAGCDGVTGPIPQIEVPTATPIRGAA